MAKTPYSHQPDDAFWGRAISRTPREAVDPVISAKFTIAPGEQVATAGSCFAQHIARHMRKLGRVPMVTEHPHPDLGADPADFHYGVYTARYGNLYTARQFVQLVRRAFGEFEPVEQPWRGPDGSFIDPFRPLIPEGFATLDEFNADRRQHFQAVREMIRDMDCLVFTLGLTEAWRSKADGAVFPSCPGAAAGRWDPELYEFVNFGVTDVVADLEQLWTEISRHNPRAKLILTVSPVPLVATATKDHVLVATTYSKSVLRVAAEEFSSGRSDVAYFPSYEIVVGPQARGMSFEDDCREVRQETVALVMGVFAKHYLGEGVPAAEAAQTQTAAPSFQAASAALDAVCDEIYNDPQRAAG
jgi:hypothetical protein